MGKLALRHAAIPLLFLALALGACASRKNAEVVKIPLNCSGAYVILPANYIIDIAAGARITLNPGVQEFALFCDPDDAKNALKLEIKNLPEGSDWRVYRLEGAFSDLAAPDGNGNFRLNRQGIVTDWLDQ